MPSWMKWFDRQRIYLDGLESQLRGLVKSIDIVAKQRTGRYRILPKLHIHAQDYYVTRNGDRHRRVVRNAWCSSIV